uniref:GTP cyclohydrolase 1 feedback regulatory protein n=2 Tax=Salarias fasciatus TaxID=181472 RepID=A0A672HFA2_SALFA
MRSMPGTRRTDAAGRAVIGSPRWVFPHSAPSRQHGAQLWRRGRAASTPERRRHLFGPPGGITDPSPGAGMPYMLISTQIRLENGPTNVGDEFSDPAVMNYLGARKTTMLGNNFSEYHVDDPPRLVLDKLEKLGFRVLSMTGVGQTLVWCLHKETE